MGHLDHHSSEFIFDQQGNDAEICSIAVKIYLVLCVNHKLDFLFTSFLFTSTSEHSESKIPSHEGVAWFSTVALTTEWKSMADKEERNQACRLCDVDDL